MEREWLLELFLCFRLSMASDAYENLKSVLYSTIRNLAIMIPNQSLYPPSLPWCMLLTPMLNGTTSLQVSVVSLSLEFFSSHLRADTTSATHLLLVSNIATCRRCVDDAIQDLLLRGTKKHRGLYHRSMVATKIEQSND